MRHLADKIRSILPSAYTTQYKAKNERDKGRIECGGGGCPPMAVDLTIQFRLESVISNCYFKPPPLEKKKLKSISIRKD